MKRVYNTYSLNSKGVNNGQKMGDACLDMLTPFFSGWLGKAVMLSSSIFEWHVELAVSNSITFCLLFHPPPPPRLGILASLTYTGVTR